MNLPRKLKMIDDAMRKKLNNEMAEQGLTMVQHHALVYLMFQPEHTAELKSIEREFHVSQPTMVGIVQRLEAKGFVESKPHPTDRRVKLVCLTEMGEALCRESREKMLRGEKKMLEGLSEAELAELDRLLEIIYRNIESSD